MAEGMDAASYESLPLSLTFGINIALFLEPVAKYAQENVKESLFNSEHLIAVLDTVYRDEQEPIRLRDAMMEQYGVDSKQANKYQQIYNI